MSRTDSTTGSHKNRQALDHDFTAVLQKSPNPGGWTYVVMPGSAAFFGTEAWSRSGAPSTGTRSEPPSWPSATAPTSCL